MVQIRIDPELRELLDNERDLRESHNDVLRRLIVLPAWRDRLVRKNVRGRLGRTRDQVVELASTGEVLALQRYLVSAEFLLRRTVTSRYLAFVGWIFRRRGLAHALTAVEPPNRTRVYFSLDRKQLEQSGTLVAARRVPGTNAWALTNMRTERKLAVVRDVLRAFGHPYSMESFAISQIELGVPKRTRRAKRK